MGLAKECLCIAHGHRNSVGRAKGGSRASVEVEKGGGGETGDVYNSVNNKNI